MTGTEAIAIVKAALELGEIPNLTGANLTRADLARANLADANLADGVTLPEGVTFGEFIDVVLPALLKAGGRAVLVEAWACHSWQNCPMAEAFGVHDLSKVPALWRPWASRFVQLFDGKALEGEVRERVFKACGIACPALPATRGAEVTS